MKIAVNCWVLRNKQLDGIGYFTVNSIAGIIRDHPEVHFQILCDKGYSEKYFDFPNVSLHPIFPAYRHPLLYIFYMEWMLPFFLAKHKPDLFLSVDGMLSLVSGCKQLPVIHDINFVHNPEDLTFKNRVYYNYFFKRFVHKAIRIATVSEYSKQDIMRVYNIAPEKIDNVSNAVGTDFRPLPAEEVTAVREKWSAGKPYFFFVGSMHPRKNIVRLIQGFALFKKRTGADVNLLLAGSVRWKASDIREAYDSNPYRESIFFTGRLSDEEVKKVLGASFALSFVPVFEGFGMPIVEAMESDVPVISSNVTSMPEVAGDAAILVDPFDIGDIAAALEKLYADDHLRSELIRKGRIQKGKFSWDHTASLLWKTILKSIG